MKDILSENPATTAAVLERIVTGEWGCYGLSVHFNNGGSKAQVTVTGQPKASHNISRKANHVTVTCTLDLPFIKINIKNHPS